MDNRPSALTLAVTGCVLVFVGGIGLWATQAEGELAARFVTALASLITGVPIIVGLLVLSAWGVACVPTLVRAWDWWEARKSSKNVTKSVTNEANAKTDPNAILEAEWRDYYTDVACIAKTEGGLAYRKKFEKYMSNPQWSATVRDALCEARVAVKINYNGGESADWRPGWNADTFAGWLVGNLPPHPDAHPPKLDRAVQADKQYTGKQEAYSPDTADTVYAKDV